MPENLNMPETPSQPVPEPAAQTALEPGAPTVAQASVEPTSIEPAATEPASPEPATDPTAPAEANAAEAGAAPKPADLAPAACGALLAQHFPALFGAGRALPIKLRVQADIQQRVPGVFSRKSLSIFLHRHTTSTPYIKALLNSPHRFDLDGQPAGEVAEEHRAAATAELERRQALIQARRAAEREAFNAARRAGPRAPVGTGAATPGPGAEGTAGAAIATGPEGAPGPHHPRPPRPPRPPQGPGAARPAARPEGRRDGRPQGRAQGPGEGRTEGQPPSRREDRRPPKPAHDAARPPHPPRPPRPPQPPVPDTAATPAEPAVPLTPEQAAEFEARRSRAAVLRAYETTTLTRANFCALKGMNDAALEAILVQARAERGQRPR